LRDNHDALKVPFIADQPPITAKNNGNVAFLGFFLFSDAFYDELSYKHRVDSHALESAIH
jgi:hypothetical protein